MRKYATTIISHKIREKFDISLSAYVVADALNSGENIMDANLMQENYFMHTRELNDAISELLEKELIYFDSIFYVISNTWKKAFGNFEEEFEAFWEPMVINNRTIRWTNTKANGLIAYKTARKLETADYLLAQKESYFEMISESDFRQVMGCPVFLNTKTKRYSEDWESQLKRNINTQSKAKMDKGHKQENSQYDDDLFK